MGTVMIDRQIQCRYRHIVDGDADINVVVDLLLHQLGFGRGREK